MEQESLHNTSHGVSTLHTLAVTLVTNCSRHKGAILWSLHSSLRAPHTLMESCRRERHIIGPCNVDIVEDMCATSIGVIHTKRNRGQALTSSCTLGTKQHTSCNTLKIKGMHPV